MLSYWYHLTIVLVYFSTGENQLKSLPSEIGNLANLQEFWLGKLTESVLPLHLSANLCSVSKLVQYLFYLIVYFCFLQMTISLNHCQLRLAICWLCRNFPCVSWMNLFFQGQMVVHSQYCYHIYSNSLSCFLLPTAYNKLISVPTEIGNLLNLQELRLGKLNEFVFSLYLIADGSLVSVMLP